MFAIGPVTRNKLRYAPPLVRSYDEKSASGSDRSWHTETLLRPAVTGNTTARLWPDLVRCSWSVADRLRAPAWPIECDPPSRPRSTHRPAAARLAEPQPRKVYRQPDSV